MNTIQSSLNSTNNELASIIERCTALNCFCRIPKSTNTQTKGYTSCSYILTSRVSSFSRIFIYCVQRSWFKGIYISPRRICRVLHATLPTPWIGNAESSWLYAGVKQHQHRALPLPLHPSPNHKHNWWWKLISQKIIITSTLARCFTAWGWRTMPQPIFWKLQLRNRFILVEHTLCGVGHSSHPMEVTNPPAQHVYTGSTATYHCGGGNGRKTKLSLW